MRNTCAFWAALAAGFLLLLPGCRNPLNPANETPGTGEGIGTLSLTIARPTLGRTVMPEIALADFDEFRLVFTDSETGRVLSPKTLTVEDLHDGTGTIELPVGTWDLEITAFLKDGEGNLLAVAEGNGSSIQVPLGGSGNAMVTLIPIPGGTGTFSWNLTFYPGIAAAMMEIRRWDDDGDIYLGPFHFRGDAPTAETTYSIPLDAGKYRVILTMHDGREEVAISEILHVYTNMTSLFDREFDNLDFPVSLLYFVLGAWDGDAGIWAFAAGITARHFAVLGIHGTADADISEIAYWFNRLSFAGGVYESANDLRVLVDAALVGMGTDADFRNDVLLNRLVVQPAIETMVANYSDMAFRWENGYRTLIVGIGAGISYVEDAAYLVPIDFGRVIRSGHVPWTAAVVATTNIDFEFEYAVQLAQRDIAIIDGTGAATIAGLTGGGTSWSLAVNVARAGSVSILIDRTGIESGPWTTTVIKPRRISAGLAHTVTVTANGEMWAWGQKTVNDINPTPARIGTATNWAYVSAGGYYSSSVHTAAIKTDGSLWVLDNDSDTLPRQIGTATNWVSVSAGGRHAVAVRTDGSLWAWGDNSSGQLGIGDICCCDGGTWYSDIPVRIGTATNWMSVSAGGWHTVAVTTTGELWVWGDNGDGQLGIGDVCCCDGGTYSPMQIGTATNWATVSAGGRHTVAVTTTGELWAWGGNSFGQLGDGTGGCCCDGESIPVRIGAATNWATVSAGYEHTIAVTTTGELWAWGRNHYGQLGDDRAWVCCCDGGMYRTSPVRIGTATNWTSVSAGGLHTVGIKIDGTVWAWGGNDVGQLGNGMAWFEYINSPLRLETTMDWAAVSVGGSHTMAITTNDELWAWGSNVNGQLGDGTGGVCCCDGGIPYRNSPVRIGTATNWATVSAGDSHTVAITTNGELWAWGSSVDGQLGDGGIPYRNSPVRIGTATNWATVSAGGNHTVAITTNGELWSLGSTDLVRIGTATNWSSVSMSHGHTVAVTTNGELWAWGRNQYGQLGDGTGGGGWQNPDMGHRTSPVRIGTATNWSSVSAGAFFTVAVTTNGELWAWGENVAGQLGDGTGGFVGIRHRNSPVRIAATTNWASVSAGYMHTVAVTTNGELWAWGRNSEGQLGDGRRGMNRYFPVRIGTATNWLSVSAGLVNTVAITTDNEIWVWGANYYGQLGVASEQYRTSPGRVYFLP